MDVPLEPCSHWVKLGDGTTQVHITQYVTLDVSLYDDEGNCCEPISTELYVMPDLGEEIIIGLREILGNYYDFFTTVLERARSRQPAVRVARLQQLYERGKEHLCAVAVDRAGTNSSQTNSSRTDSSGTNQTGVQPNRKLLKAYAKEARAIGSWYSKHKWRVLSDRQHTETLQTNGDGTTFSILSSPTYGTAYGDNSVETLCEIVQSFMDFPVGQIMPPWSQPTEECPEEIETPDPLAFGPDVLHYMETSVEEARQEYLDLLEKQITPEMRQAQPRVMEIMTSPAAMETFAPSAWNGLKIPPVTFDVIPGMPAAMPAQPRPIRPDLYAHAKKEFDRLAQYFYEVDPRKCTSPIASPLVIAPKATSPFIRFCGDYRQVNEFISIPQHPIPVVQHELAKASQFKVFVDLDMTNSFHQIPLSDQASQLLSVRTPWGLVRPKFLPEGVGPASGLLQSIVRQIFDFEDFPDWTIVIFDNFLVLANDYEDAANKLERVIARCAEFGVVLKIKKSFIGASTVTFFGYEVTHQKWKLSDSRKSAIDALPFPSSKKEMQSFLGAALFFHNHIPDYSQWSAKLYEMTHDGFSWDPGTWKFGYRAHFELFKTAIQEACTLYFPRYDLPWIIRCDASEHAVGAVLFQVVTNLDGSVDHQPIAFSSKRFSGPATKWDAYKREAYAIYHSVHAFSWYLRGKEFLVETDHRNLQWIETSLSPIVCRWRALLQAFQFKIRHIPGRENRVADWMSRPAIIPRAPTEQSAVAAISSQTNLSQTNLPRRISPDGLVSDELGSDELVSDDFVRTNSSNTAQTHTSTVPSSRSLDSILQEVHGDRHLHYGASHTWKRAKALYPDARISIRSVRDYVRECPMCQKTRDTGITGLKPRTLSLKPPTYRRTVGVDHVAVTPKDKHGHDCAIMVVEHFSHFPFVYAAKDYTAETVAITLFKHYCHHGTFDQVASDPGSAFMSEVVRQLNAWLGIAHKVSLVGRHQSNGTEASNKQFIRHLTTLVLDERLYDRWSDDTVLPLINLHLASYPTEETGGYTPLQLKYGTLDAARFNLPEQLLQEPGVRAAAIVKALDENLQTIRSISRKLQAELAAERAEQDKNISSYEPGDLVLFNPREQPSDHLPSKLSPNWLGPYSVINQVKNDVAVKHIVLNTEAVLHVERLKPFFGTFEEAVSIARHDQHQFNIIQFNYYTGNPFLRTSMTFNITFEDGTITMPYGGDFIDSQQFEAYILATPELFPLRFPVKVATREINRLERLAITSATPGMEAFVNIRIYDGKTSVWFDSLQLPHKDKPYLMPIRFTKWYYRNSQRLIEAVVPLFGNTHPKYTLYLTSYDIIAYVRFEWEYWTTILLDEQKLAQYPQILRR